MHDCHREHEPIAAICRAAQRCSVSHTRPCCDSRAQMSIRIQMGVFLEGFGYISPAPAQRTRS